MKCNKSPYGLTVLTSDRIETPDPTQLQTFTYINEVGKSYRKGDKGAILRTADDAAAPQHCLTCVHEHSQNLHGQVKWLLACVWHFVSHLLAGMTLFMSFITITTSFLICLVVMLTAGRWVQRLRSKRALGFNTRVAWNKGNSPANSGSLFIESNPGESKFSV